MLPKPTHNTNGTEGAGCIGCPLAGDMLGFCPDEIIEDAEVQIQAQGPHDNFRFCVPLEGQFQFENASGDQIQIQGLWGVQLDGLIILTSTNEFCTTRDEVLAGIRTFPEVVVTTDVNDTISGLPNVFIELDEATKMEIKLEFQGSN